MQLMVRKQSASARTVGGKSRHAVEPGCEALETRVVLSASRSVQAMLQMDAHPGQGYHPAVIGTISGQVTNDKNGRGVAHVRVQLIDSNGHVAQTTLTNGKGGYSFKVRENGAYVVREVTPR